jgi:hypothetical protein
MNGWKLTRRIGRIALPGVAGAIVACAHAPPPQEISIVEAIETSRQATGPASCAALNATTVCKKSTRFDDGSRDCTCLDARALTGTGVLRR